MSEIGRIIVSKFEEADQLFSKRNQGTARVSTANTHTEVIGLDSRQGGLDRYIVSRPPIGSPKKVLEPGALDNSHRLVVAYQLVRVSRSDNDARPFEKLDREGIKGTFLLLDAESSRGVEILTGGLPPVQLESVAIDGLANAIARTRVADFIPFDFRQ